MGSVVLLPTGQEPSAGECRSQWRARPAQPVQIVRCKTRTAANSSVAGAVLLRQAATGHLASTEKQNTSQSRRYILESSARTSSRVTLRSPRGLRSTASFLMRVMNSRRSFLTGSGAAGSMAGSRIWYSRKSRRFSRVGSDQAMLLLSR